jgi:hypothetical protein
VNSPSALVARKQFTVWRFTGLRFGKETRYWHAEDVIQRVTKQPGYGRIGESDNLFRIQYKDAIRARLCQGMELHIVGQT